MSVVSTNAGVQEVGLTIHAVTPGHYDADGDVDLEGFAALPRQLEGSGFPIGIVDEAGFEDYHISMGPGDRLYFYADGITEEVNAQGELFGDDRLLSAIAEGQALSLNDTVESLVRQVVAWRGEDHLRDDLSILAIAVD